MRAQWINQIENYAYPVLGEMPLSAIDRAAVLRTFAPHWVAGKVHAASRVLRRVAAIIDYATQHGWRQGDNPASWKHLQHALARPQTLSPAKQMAALPYAEVPKFFASLGDTVTERAIKFTLLTAVRSSEALGARWTEIDFERAIWAVPGARMKMRKEHIVPLSSAALEIVKSLPHEKANPHIFIGAHKGTSLSPVSMITVLNRRGCAFTVHGFRATFKTWSEEMTNFPPDLAEHALAHQVGTQTERAYARSTLIEKRRLLMEAWAGFVTGTEIVGATVIPLRAPA
jgi:integrase